MGCHIQFFVDVKLGAAADLHIGLFGFQGAWALG